MLDQAREERRQRMVELGACCCAWPLVVNRNMTGHAPDCPAHELLEARIARR